MADPNPKELAIVHQDVVDTSSSVDDDTYAEKYQPVFDEIDDAVESMSDQDAQTFLDQVDRQNNL